MDTDADGILSNEEALVFFADLIGVHCKSVYFTWPMTAVALLFLLHHTPGLTHVLKNVAGLERIIIIIIIITKGINLGSMHPPYKMGAPGALQ